jgi:hypothetical protein
LGVIQHDTSAVELLQNQADAAATPCRAAIRPASAARPAKIILQQPLDSYRASAYKKRREPVSCCAAFTEKQQFLLVVLGLENFTPTVETIRADVMPHMRFASCRLNSQRRRYQEIVCTMHTALRRGFFVLLDSHDNS